MKYIIICSTLALAYVAITTTFPQVQALMEERATELVCVAEHIATGIERINIRTHNGTCTVEANGYYK